MAISNRLRTFLDGQHIKYTKATHPMAYTAQEIAAAQHVPGRQLAKSVLINADREPVLAVLPAIELVDLTKLKGLIKAKKVSIAREGDIRQKFPDVEVGAMSPFGNLYDVPIVLDKTLASASEIVFNAGSHTDTIKMRYEDFARLTNPKLGVFGKPIEQPAKPKPKRRATAKKRKAKTPRRRPSPRKKTKTRSRPATKKRARSRRR